MATDFTPTESRILAALSDGKPHRPSDLAACLNSGEYASASTLRMHISNIRRKLPPCEAIHFVHRNKWGYYIHVRLLTPGC